MAEPTPGAPGSGTSEFKLALVAVVLGTILEGVAGVMQTLQDSGHAAPWFPAVLAVLAVLLQVASLFGYTKSRTLVKAALIASDAPVNSSPK